MATALPPSFSALAHHPALGARHPHPPSGAGASAAVGVGVGAGAGAGVHVVVDSTAPHGQPAQPLNISFHASRNLSVNDRVDGFSNLNKPSSSSSQTSHSYRRAKALLDNLSRSISSSRSRNNSSSFLMSPAFGPLVNQASNSQLAMSLSRSLGKSWTREAFIDSLAMHLDPKRSPFMPPSPSRDQQQFAMLEDKFCKDFSCCDTVLENMHDLLQHYEEYHARFEADDEFDSDEDEENGFDFSGDNDYDHLPFGFDTMDNDMDMDMDEFDVVSAQQQQEFNTAFLRAQIAAMSTNAQQQPVTMSQFPDASLLARTPPTIISRATVSSVLGAGTPLFNPNSGSPFSLIQKHDNQVDDFRIMASQQQQLPSLQATPTQPIRMQSEILFGSGGFGDSTPSRRRNNSALGVVGATATASKTGRVDVNETSPTVSPSKVKAVEDSRLPSTSVNGDSANSSSRPFKCKVEGCGKEYKNANGLKYHMKNVHPVDDIVEIDANAASDKPYMCTADGCGKRYKNLNGLKYHIQHAHIELLGTGDNTVVGE